MAANRVETLAGAVATYVKPGMTVALEDSGTSSPRRPRTRSSGSGSGT